VPGSAAAADEKGNFAEGLQHLKRAVVLDPKMTMARFAIVERFVALRT
jgi:hypothetical protein